MKKNSKELVHEGDYVAEVDVDLIVGESEWSPCLSVEDALKLEEVRLALRAGDLPRAATLAKVYALTPVAP